MENEYHFSETNYEIDDITESIIVSYPKRESVSAEIWAIHQNENEEYMLADVFYDPVKKCDIVKIFVDGKECNFRLTQFVEMLNHASQRLHARDTSFVNKYLQQ